MLSITLAMAAPLILAAMGGYTSERSGIVNIALEGKMLTAACTAALVSARFGAVAGLFAALLAAILLSLLHYVATQKLSMDHVVSGMAVNAISLGGTNFANNKFANMDSTGMTPHLPAAFYYAIALLSPIGLWAYSKYVRGGLWLLSVGNDPDKARLAGIAPLRVRFAALVATGVFTGLAGALIFTETGVFTDNMTAGKGYIALAALVLSGWRPLPAMIAGIAFGFFSSLQLQVQGTHFFGASLPAEAWAALPYIVTIVALAGFLGRNRTPAGLGKP